MTFQKIVRSILSLMCCFFVVSSANAVIIEYEVTALGGNSFQYDYSIFNNDIADGVEGISVYFDYGVTSNISTQSSPDGWDSVLFPEDDFFIEGPVFDSSVFDPLLTPDAVVGLGETLSGFSIQFDWLGGAEPGSQFFEVYNPFPFQRLALGDTSPKVNNVPEPGSLALLALGLLGLSLRRRMN